VLPKRITTNRHQGGNGFKADNTLMKTKKKKQVDRESREEAGGTLGTGPPIA